MSSSLFAEAAPPLFTLTDIIPLAIFGLFAALAWFALEYMAAAKPRALERLDEIKNPQKRRSAQAEAILKKPDTVSKVLEKTSALTQVVRAEERGRCEQAEEPSGQRRLPGRRTGADLLRSEVRDAPGRVLLRRRHVAVGQGLQPEHADVGGGRERPVLLAAEHRLGPPGEEPAAGHLPGLARRVGHDDRVRRGGAWPGPGDAEGERRNEEALPGARGRVHLDELPVADGPHAGRSPARTGAADRRGRPARLWAPS